MQQLASDRASAVGEIGELVVVDIEKRGRVAHALLVADGFDQLRHTLGPLRHRGLITADRESGERFGDEVRQPVGVALARQQPRRLAGIDVE